MCGAGEGGRLYSSGRCGAWVGLGVGYRGASSPCVYAYAQTCVASFHKAARKCWPHPAAQPAGCGPDDGIFGHSPVHGPAGRMDSFAGVLRREGLSRSPRTDRSSRSQNIVKSDILAARGSPPLLTPAKIYKIL